MNKCIRIAGVAACCLAVLVISGGHWFALQSFAWVRMTIQFTEDGSLGSALAKTFSGRHPCSLCLKVQQGQQEDQKKQQLPWSQNEKLPEVVWELRSFSAPAQPIETLWESPFASFSYSSRIDSPPSPPPRA